MDNIEIGISLIRYALENNQITHKEAADNLCVSEERLDAMLRREKGETPTQTQKRSEKEFLEMTEDTQ